MTGPAGSGVAAADVYFLMDTTGSMGGPISSLKAAASDVMNDLVTTFPDVDLAFGAGDFKDFPGDPYAFRHQVSLTDDTAAVQAGINAWSASGGADIAEGQFYAFDQLAEDRAPSNDGSPAGTIGWRPEAKRILVTPVPGRGSHTFRGRHDQAITRAVVHPRWTVPRDAGASGPRAEVKASVTMARWVPAPRHSRAGRLRSAYTCQRPCSTISSLPRAVAERMSNRTCVPATSLISDRHSPWHRSTQRDAGRRSRTRSWAHG